MATYLSQLAHEKINSLTLSDNCDKKISYHNHKIVSEGAKQFV